MNNQTDTHATVVYSIRQLTKNYRSDSVNVHALRGIDLDIYAGEFIVFLGPSGSGKSTLLNLLGGLDTPSSGEIFYRDSNLGALDGPKRTAYRREQIGYVFQFYNLIPSLTARENVALVTEIATDSLSPEEALAQVNLSARLEHFPAQLSGGEQQRVAVARAIAKKPSVLLCDEPTGALDNATGIVVLEAIQRLSRMLQTTTVLITHNVVIAGLADRVVYFANGKISGIRRNAQPRPANELLW